MKCLLSQREQTPSKQCSSWFLGERRPWMIYKVFVVFLVFSSGSPSLVMILLQCSGPWRLLLQNSEMWDSRNPFSLTSFIYRRESVAGVLPIFPKLWYPWRRMQLGNSSKRGLGDENREVWEQERWEERTTASYRVLLLLLKETMCSSTCRCTGSVMSRITHF